MSGGVQKTSEECAQWMQRVHAKQSQRSPEACAAARQRIEEARQREVCTRKCKAAKGHSIRSRALATESLRQMAVSAPAEQMAVQARWKSAQEASSVRQMVSMTAMESVSSMQGSTRRSAAVKLRSADEEEQDAMVEVAAVVGAADASAMAAIGSEGLAPPGAQSGGRSSTQAGNSVDELLKQLRKEPTNEDECAAKFMLYEGYSSQVEEMRGTLLKFHEEAKPTVPASVMAGMDKEIRRIDCAECMGIPDDAREWFVYHMMRQAERNNLKMASILDGFEKKLEFLASSDQSECPVCLEPFTETGDNMPETLGCCHKVCKQCWDHWSSMMGARAFCPLCRNDDFLGAVASRAAGTAGPSFDSDDDF